MSSSSSSSSASHSLTGGTREHFEVAAVSVEHWTDSDSVRELISNMHDAICAHTRSWVYKKIPSGVAAAETVLTRYSVIKEVAGEETEIIGKIHYDANLKRLCLTNYHVPMSKAWVKVIGASRKGAATKAIGVHGEGTKRAAARLFKSGKSLWFHTESWCATYEQYIDPDTKLDCIQPCSFTPAQCPHQHHHERSRHPAEAKAFVTVEVDGLSYNDIRWDDFRFLHMSSSTRTKQIPITVGDAGAGDSESLGYVLREAADKGRIYLRGVHYCTRPALPCGFDLYRSTAIDRMNRDRNTLGTAENILAHYVLSTVSSSGFSQHVYTDEFLDYMYRWLNVRTKPADHYGGAKSLQEVVANVLIEDDWMDKSHPFRTQIVECFDKRAAESYRKQHDAEPPRRGLVAVPLGVKKTEYKRLSMLLSAGFPVKHHISVKMPLFEIFWSMREHTIEMRQASIVMKISNAPVVTMGALNANHRKRCSMVVDFITQLLAPIVSPDNNLDVPVTSSVNGLTA